MRSGVHSFAISSTHDSRWVLVVGRSFATSISPSSKSWERRYRLARSDDARHDHGDGRGDRERERDLHQKGKQRVGVVEDTRQQAAATEAERVHELEAGVAKA